MAPLLRRGLLVLIALAACKPAGTGPKTPYQPPPGVNLRDPQGVISGVAAFEAAFGAPVIHSVTGLGAYVNVPASPPAPGAASAQCGVRAAGPDAPFASPLGVLPDSDLGRVLVYDSASRTFVVGSDTGGPAGGVRFVLPALDLVNQVEYPLQSTGTLDLFDLTPPAGMLTLHSVLTGAGTAADYTFVDSGATTAYSGILTGRVSGAGRIYGFRDSTTGLYAEVTAAAVLDDSTTGARMVLTASRTATDPFDNFYDLDFSYRWSGGTVRLLGNITTYCLLPSIGLTVSVNDSDFAIVNQGQSGPVVTGLSDSTLTPAQDSAIQSLIRGQGELFSWLTALAQPARQFLGP